MSRSIWMLGLTVALGACSSEPTGASYREVLAEIVDAGKPMQDGCTKDSDCVMAEVNTLCVESCLFPVLASNEAAFEAAAAQIGGVRCYPRPIIDCFAVVPVCVDGRCSHKEPEFDGGP